MIRQIWQSFFLRPSQPSDNHSLSNVLGASLLLRDSEFSSGRAALMKLLQTLTLLPPAGSPTVHDTKGIDAAFRRVYSTLKSNCRHPLELLLVDDDHKRHHWSSFVAKSLGLSDTKNADDTWKGKIAKFDTRLSTTDSAKDLLDALKLAEAKGENLCWDSGSSIDVLYLDLRLFERQTLREEARFILEVADLARKIATQVPSHPGDWPRMSDLEIQTIARWCHSAIDGGHHVSRDDREYIDAITLLPRVVATIDTDLPIVLFSSTQRRRVTEKLRPYENIITCFSKPVLRLGQSEEQLNESLWSFQHATTQAIEAVSARRLRQFLSQETFSLEWRGHVEKPIDELSEQAWSIQLLLDETGNEPITVGGFLAVYPPGVSLDKVDKEISKAHPNIRNGKSKYRKEKLSSLIWNVIGILDRHEVLIVPIALTGNRTTTTTAHSGWTGSDAFRDELVADNMHRELMRCLIELGLFVFARQILPETATVEFSFHAPTRVLPVSADDAKALDNTWGVPTWRGRRGDLLAGHMGIDSARPLVDEVFREYRGSTFEPIGVKARAFKLSDDANPSERKKVHSLQYLADGWLHNQEDAQLDAFNKLAIRGTYGPKFSCLLSAHRHLLQGNIAQAVLIGSRIAMTLNPSQHTTAVDSILVALQTAANSMTGPESRELAALLKDEGSRNAEEFLCGVVQSISSDDQIVVESGGKRFRTTSRRCTDELRPGDEVQFRPRRGNRPGTFQAYSVRKMKIKGSIHHRDSEAT
ncbi:MAG: hypothetical protein AAFX06_21920 [Planctomycetota bacterium]